MDNISFTFSQYNLQLSNALRNINSSEIQNILLELVDCFENNKKIFIIGNGGSAANASHFAQDLVKGTFPEYHGLRDENSKTFKAISLCDNTSFITAVANDDGYENIFVEQLKALSDASDVLIIISGSGNSPNVVNAARYCKQNNIKVISFTGFDGGQIKYMSDLNLNVEYSDMLIVENVHSILFHYIIKYLKEYRSGIE